MQTKLVQRCKRFPGQAQKVKKSGLELRLHTSRRAAVGRCVFSKRTRFAIYSCNFKGCYTCKLIKTSSILFHFQLTA